MGSKTNIEWATASWNPVVGCTKVSAACASCYAESIAWRFKGRVPVYAEVTEPRVPGEGGRWANKAVLVRERLCDPMGWRAPKRIFVCSMSDIGHESLRYREIAAVLAVATLCPQHKFLWLTKRPQRLVAFFGWLAEQAEADKRLFPADSYGWRIRRLLWAALHQETTGRTGIVFDKPEDGPWPLPNLWFGVTVEHADTLGRISDLLRLPAVADHYFVSAEPLLGSLTGPEAGVQWLARQSVLGVGEEQNGWRERMLSWCIAGGETGPKARPMLDSWVDDLEIACGEAGVPWFFKSWGAWREYPTIDDACWDAAVEAWGEKAVRREAFDRGRIVQLVRVADVCPGKEVRSSLHGERRQRVPDDLLLPGERRRA